MNYELEEFDYYFNQTTQISLPLKINSAIMAHAQRTYDSARIARDDLLNQLKLERILTYIQSIPSLEPVPSSYEELTYETQSLENEMLELEQLLNKEQSENQSFEGQSIGKEQVLFNPKIEGAQQDPKSPDDSVSEVGASSFQNDDDGCC